MWHVARTCHIARGSSSSSSNRCGIWLNYESAACNLQTCKIANRRRWRWLIEENCENSDRERAREIANERERETRPMASSGLRCVQTDSWDSKFITHTLDYFEASPNKFRRGNTHTHTQPPAPHALATSCHETRRCQHAAAHDAGRPKAKNCIANRKDKAEKYK